MTKELILLTFNSIIDDIKDLTNQTLQVKGISPNDYRYNIELDKAICNANSLIYRFDNIKRSISDNDDELKFLKESCERYIQSISDMVKDLTLIRISNQERLQQIRRRIGDYS